MADLYSNENFPLPVFDELRKFGHDVLTIQETGKSDQSLSDEAVLKFAIAKERILITLNRKHFIKLHELEPIHNGIIVCSFDIDFNGQAKRIHDALCKEKEIKGKLIRVNRPLSPPTPQAGRVSPQRRDG